MISQRKDDHVRLARTQRESSDMANEFDDVRFVHHALAGIDRSDLDLTVRVAGMRWNSPLFINAMTGGSEHTGNINRQLAIAARQTGLAMATGSMSAFLRDPDTADTYRVVRDENPDGIILANINADTSVADARRAVHLLRADALQIHLNAVQETVMPEGDRSFGAWAANIGRIVAGVDVPVIVKEVGFGLSRETVAALRDLGVAAADVAGRGGTNFALIENGRRRAGDYGFLADWGQSAPACLLDALSLEVPLIASGGVRHPLDVARALALGASAVGVSGAVLDILLTKGLDALIAEIHCWLDQLAGIMVMLGASTPPELADRDLVITGELASFCAARGIRIDQLAARRARRAAKIAVRRTPSLQ
ncbi:type 2 isopentenyl-diphosphate Delta-isomerase [Nocardia sp. NPDC051030]|uniref:type 2 isopentenyl-diphosphate Delta-isomerase n=1 Tax=Nocardia sp. NPDC051030 TaxID=3155162 RepID=UPI003445226F